MTLADFFQHSVVEIELLGSLLGEVAKLYLMSELTASRLNGNPLSNNF